MHASQIAMHTGAARPCRPPAPARRHWRGLLLAAYMNVHAPVFYELLTSYLGKVRRECRV